MGYSWGDFGGRSCRRCARRERCFRDVSRGDEQQWRKTYGKNLRIAALINKRIAPWDDAKWDQGIELLNQLTAEQFGEAMASNFMAAGRSGRSPPTRDSCVKVSVSLIDGHLIVLTSLELSLRGATFFACASQ